VHSMGEKQSILSAKISPGRKIVLPKVIMDELNLQVGDYVGFDKVKGKYVLRPAEIRFID
jgi:AbrB family looped-hinge helix DNA binding protein